MSLKIGAAYIRASTDDQLEYSPDSQRKNILGFAKREGYYIPEEYIYQDDGISGKKADKRPAFRLMIATAKEEHPPFDAIFVWEFSRFARNQEESIMYKNLLRKRGIAVKSMREPLSDSPFSSLIERIIEWMDEYYLINLAIEVRRGMAEKASRGEPMSIAPFGYRLQDGAFVPNENADIVRSIFSQYAAGKGYRTIAAELGAQGIRTTRGKIPDNRWVKYILGNPVYIGKIRWSTEGMANYGRPNFSGENVMVVDGKHEAIIDSETWAKAQERLNRKDTEIKYRPKHPSHMFPLKGLVRCSACGSTLITHGSSGKSYLQCHKYSRGQCHASHAIMLDRAMQAVLESLSEILESGTFLFAPAPRAETPVTRDWDKLIRTEGGRLERARQALLDGVFSTEEYREAKLEIEDTLSQLREAKQAEEESVPKQTDPKELTRKTANVLTILKSPDVSAEAKNAALTELLEKIVYHRDTNHFDIFFNP